jgi:membrane protein DedA with SNARE-associated domain
MNDLLSLLARHGYLALAVVVGLGACGLPLPVIAAVIAAGVASARHVMRPEIVLLVTLAALTAGDLFLYLLGRAMGWFLVGILCRVSQTPEECILRSAESFSRRGGVALIVAKFIPAVGTLACPLAGSMKMRPAVFLQFDVIGSFLYVCFYGGLGYWLGDLATVALQRARPIATLLCWVVAGAALVYVVYRMYCFWKQRQLPEVPRITVEDLATRLAAAPPGSVSILDVRSHGYYDPDARRIKGSVRMEPNNLLANLNRLSREVEHYLYCT